jgi:type II secretory pathway pseudopilin PulG
MLWRKCARLKTRLDQFTRGFETSLEPSADSARNGSSGHRRRTRRILVGDPASLLLWTAWIHVGPPRLLFHTPYGETLLVKLILVLVLVGLGAVNQLWLLPRVNAIRADGEDGTALAVTLRHFRGVVAAEAVIGLLVLLVVPFLSGSARKQELEKQSADLTQTALGGGQEIRLRPSGAQPGPTDYDVWAPGAEGRVAVVFSSPGSASRLPRSRRRRSAATTTGSAASTRRWSASGEPASSSTAALPRRPSR